MTCRNYLSNNCGSEGVLSSPAAFAVFALSMGLAVLRFMRSKTSPANYGFDFDKKSA